MHENKFECPKPYKRGTYEEDKSFRQFIRGDAAEI